MKWQNTEELEKHYRNFHSLYEEILYDLFRHYRRFVLNGQAYATIKYNIDILFTEYACWSSSVYVASSMSLNFPVR